MLVDEHQTCLKAAMAAQAQEQKFFKLTAKITTPLSLIIQEVAPNHPATHHARPVMSLERG